MEAIDLARVGLRMRNAQREYFRTGSQAKLRESKGLEARFDRCVAMILDGQKELDFGEEEGSLPA